jgi:nucleotide-binding universal stress UspA family protein
MPPIRTILVPVDFSPASERALTHARSIARAFGANLELLHVFENPFAAGAFMDMYTPVPDDVVQRLEAQTRTALEALLTEEERTPGRATVAARMGLPAEEILQYVREHGAIDLIVIATSGRGRVARLVMGSVADRIVRSAPCPVLTVHPHDRDVVTDAGQAA